MNRKDVPQAATALTSAKTASAGKLLKRSEAARLLGVSVSTLRRREGDILRPIVGPDGVHLFDETEVRAVMVTLRGRATLDALGPTAGDTAADVFTLLDEGHHPVEVVKRLRLTPDVVTTLHDQWARMRATFTLSPEDAQAFGHLTWSTTPTSGAQAVAQARTRIERLTRMRRGSARCYCCGDSTASVCEACVVQMRGPLSVCNLRVEEQQNEAGEGEHRVVADAWWDDVGSDGGLVAQLRSEWISSEELDESPIAEIVAGVRNRTRG